MTPMPELASSPAGMPPMPPLVPAPAGVAASPAMEAELEAEVAKGQMPAIPVAIGGTVEPAPGIIANTVAPSLKEEHSVIFDIEHMNTPHYNFPSTCELLEI